MWCFSSPSSIQCLQSLAFCILLKDMFFFSFLCQWNKTSCTQTENFIRTSWPQSSWASWKPNSITTSWCKELGLISFVAHEYICFAICKYLMVSLSQSLEVFKKQEVDFLIATDVAARVSTRSKQLIFQIPRSCNAISLVDHSCLIILGAWHPWCRNSYKLCMSSGNRQVNQRYFLCENWIKRLWAFFSLADVRTIFCFLWICSYVHRVGRTARAGRKGYAVTFVTDNDRSLLKVIVSKSPDMLWILLLPISLPLESGHFL